jgi:DnaJ-class molecular chaperone
MSNSTAWRYCAECDGEGLVWHGRRGPNDPDGHEELCETCDGEGVVAVEDEEELV